MFVNYIYIYICFSIESCGVTHENLGRFKHEFNICKTYYIKK